MKLHIDLYNQKFVISVEKGNVGVLYMLQDYFSYNRIIEAWEKRFGREFDEEREEDLKSLLSQRYIPEAVVNWASFQLTGEYKNVNTGHAFVPSFMDDGYIPLERVRGTGKKTITYRVGLLSLVLEALQSSYFSDKYGLIEIGLADKRENLVEFVEDPVFKVGEYTLRNDQQQVLTSIRNMLQDAQSRLFHTILVDLAVGFGKTILMGALVKNICNYKVVFFFRDRNLCLQAIADYLEMGFNVGCIVSKPKEVDKYLEAIGMEERPAYNKVTDFTIVMVQTLQSFLKRGKISEHEFAAVNGVFVDECEEGYTGVKTRAIFDLFKPGIQVGYSGTPLDNPSKAERLLTLSLFGGKVYKVSVAENNQNKVTLPANVKFLLHRMDEARIYNSVKYSKIYGVYYSLNRYNLMKEAVLKELEKGRQVMIYTGHAPIEVSKFLYEQMKMDIDFGQIGIGLVTGEVSVESRANIYNKFSSYDYRVIIANRVVRRGLNIPEIQTIVNFEATNNKASIIQAVIGRPCRKNGKDESFNVIEFYDLGSPEIEQLSQDRIAVLSHRDIGAKIKYNYPNKNGIPV